MENASKALIIAGAILLSILIISLGILVYNQAKEATDSASLTSTEVSTFNSQLEDYCGSGKKASEIEALFSKVQSSNAAETTNGSKRYVAIVDSAGSKNNVDLIVLGTTISLTTGKGKSLTCPSGSPTVSSSYTYTVKASYDAAGEYNSTAGYIWQLTITADS